MRRHPDIRWLRRADDSGTLKLAEIFAARKRLQLFDLSDSQIDEVIRTQKPLTNITLHAPMSGYVMMRNAFPIGKHFPSCS